MRSRSGHSGLFLSVLPATPALCALAAVMVAGVPTRSSAILLFCSVLALTLAATSGSFRRRRPQPSALRNLVDTLLEDDYSARLSPGADVSTDARDCLNALAAKLQHDDRVHRQRLHLLAKTLASLNAAVFVFGTDSKLQLVNPAAEELLGKKVSFLLGRTAQDLGLEETLSSADGSIQTLNLSQKPGRWQIPTKQIRRAGERGQLLVLQPVENMLRASEKESFSSILRVLSHEINNSLAPISSMADTLSRLLPAASEIMDDEARSDLVTGLRVIENRSQSLQRFLSGYVRLAHLPEPQPLPIQLEEICSSSASLLDCRVSIDVDPTLTVLVDPDQLGQALINLLRNACEAGGGRLVEIESETTGAAVRLRILDQGPGPPPSANLFVPFFTTKEGGSGIGLTLSKQIVEAVGGTLTLGRRSHAGGAVAELLLPLAVN